MKAASQSLVLDGNSEAEVVGVDRPPRRSALPRQALLAPSLHLPVGPLQVSVSRSVQQSAWKEEYKNSSEFTSGFHQLLLFLIRKG